MLQNLAAQMWSGQLTALTIVAWCVLAGAIGMIGGMIGGMTMGGKQIGHDLAAMMGALFGPTAAVPAIFIGMLLLAWMRG